MLNLCHTLDDPHSPRGQGATETARTRQVFTLQHESDLDTVLFTLSETAFRCGLKRLAREGGP
jgi:hypothetical protein